jgi:hypothetical protein
MRVASLTASLPRPHIEAAIIFIMILKTNASLANAVGEYRA